MTDTWNYLKEVFETADTDTDGIIYFRDLSEILKSLGQHPTQEELIDMINKVDQDGSGGINFESFCRLMKDRQRTNDTEADIKMAFQLFDTKNKGYMSRNDLRTLLEYGGEPYPDESFVEDVMQEADETGIGRIDYNQFFQMMGLCELDPQLQQSMKNAGLGLGRSQPHDDDDDDDDVYTEDEEAE